MRWQLQLHHLGRRLPRRSHHLWPPGAFDFEQETRAKRPENPWDPGRREEGHEPSLQKGSHGCANPREPRDHSANLSALSSEYAVTPFFGASSDGMLLKLPMLLKDPAARTAHRHSSRIWKHGGSVTSAQLKCHVSGQLKISRQRAAKSFDKSCLCADLLPDG